MELLLSPNLLAIPTDVWNYVRMPPEPPVLDDWRGFWLGKVLARHFVVCYFFPLLPILLLLARDRLRVGIILTGLAFVTYVFGPLYMLLWLGTCLGLHKLAERFAIECRRTDVWPLGPPLAAIAIIGGGYLIVMVLHDLELPAGAAAWLHAHAAWLYPLGARGFSWEPIFPQLHVGARDGAPQLFFTLFWDPHFIGMAYLAVRMLHYFSEIKRGGIPAERRTPLNFLAYVCYAPTLIQGPIERFTPFQDEMDECHLRRSWRNVPPAAWRIGLGLAKSLAATVYFRPLLWYELGIGNDNRYWLHPEQIESFGLLYFGVFLIIFNLYLEFSGYCDIAAGLARLLGYRQVENFNMPWLATSMRDFWRRWHISLSLILRDYVYIALGGNRRRTTLNLVITFFLCGIWHRLILQVGLWGILMGLMVVVNQRWVGWMKRLDAGEGGALSAVRRRWLRCYPLPQVCAWLVTQHAFVFSLLVFFGGSGAINVLAEIIRRIAGFTSG